MKAPPWLRRRFMTFLKKITLFFILLLYFIKRCDKIRIVIVIRESKI